MQWTFTHDRGKINRKSQNMVTIVDAFSFLSGLNHIDFEQNVQLNNSEFSSKLPLLDISISFIQ